MKIGEGIELRHGDVLEVLAGMEADSVDMAVTSPPYNQLGSSTVAGSGMHANCAWKAKVLQCGYKDDWPSEVEYIEWLGEVAAAVMRVLKPGGSFMVNHKCRYRNNDVLHPMDWIRTWEGFALRQEIVWDRRGAYAFNCRKFAPSDERVYWLVKGGAKPHWDQAAAKYMTVWPISPNSCERVSGHPCPYPIEIPRRCIVAACPDGGLVLDPFAGAGTTGVACVLTGRRFVGIDREERYLDLAAERIRAAMVQAQGGPLFAETPALPGMEGVK